MPVVAFLPTYYADELGLGLATVGAIFMLTRFWDVFSDPIFGAISDRLNLRWGRRRPWIVIGTPLLMLSTYMLFLPPPDVSGGYLIGWLLVFYTGLTLSVMSMYSWSMELSGDYHERSRIMSIVQAAMLFGTILVLVLPSVVGKFFLDTSGPVSRSAIMGTMGWFVLIVSPFCVLLCFSVMKDKRREIIAEEKLSWLDGAKVVFRSRALRAVVVADFLGGLANGVLLTLTILFARHDLGFSIIQASMLLLASYVGGFICLPVWVAICRRVSKHKALASAALLLIIVSLVAFFWLPKEAMFLGCVVWALIGACATAMQFIPRSMMADVVDEDQAEVGGNSRSGLYFSFLSLSLKFGMGLAVGIVFPILAWLGFDPSAANSPDVVLKLRQVFFLMPVFVVWPIVILGWNFPIDEQRQKALREKIEATG